MEKSTCKSCTYYRQHHCLDSRKLFSVYCGHCVFAKPKHKRPDTAACENFELGSDETDFFVSKEYLNKELLKYVLELELLPQVESDPTMSKQIK